MLKIKFNKIMCINILGDLEVTSELHEHAAAYALNQSKGNIKYCYLKLCARDCYG